MHAYKINTFRHISGAGLAISPWVARCKTSVDLLLHGLGIKLLKGGS